VTIEARPLMFRCLQEVCRLNGLSNVTALCAAVAATGHEVLISDSSNYQANTTLTERVVPVPEGTLDSIVASFGIERIDLRNHDVLADWGGVS
jgi:FkbM family methyltransferase